MVDFWKDRWIPNSKLGVIEPILTSNRFAPLQVCELIDEDTRSWKIDHIIPFITDKDARAISAIPLINPEEDDRLIWPHEKDGNYSVKTGYHCIRESSTMPPINQASSSHSLDSKIWKLCWGVKTIPKISNFLWRALNNALPTFGNLFRRKITPTPLCKLCGEGMETVEHCLLLCPWVERVWFGCALGVIINKDRITSFDRWLSSCIDSSSVPKSQLGWVMTYISFLLWEIWKMRCSAVYKNVNPSPDHTIGRGNVLASERLEATIHPSTIPHIPLNPAPLIQRWSLPTDPIVKVNVDGAWDASNLYSGVRVVIRNAQGALLLGCSLYGYYKSSIEAEAAAVVQGLTEASRLHLLNVHVECDSQEKSQFINAQTLLANKPTTSYCTKKMKIQHPSDSYKSCLAALIITD